LKSTGINSFTTQSKVWVPQFSQKSCLKSLVFGGVMQRPWSSQTTGYFNYTAVQA
jgi:hypothetical protein